MKHDLYGSDIYPRRKYRGICIKVAVVAGLILLLGYMTERDIAHHAEIAKQMECVPEMEMTMPIDPRVSA